MLPFLLPGYCRVHRDNKAESKAEKCFCLSEGTRRLADSLKVIMSSGAITYSRDLTWEHPHAPFPSASAENSHHLSKPEEGRGVLMKIRSPPTTYRPPSPTQQPPPHQPLTPPSPTQAPPPYQSLTPPSPTQPPPSVQQPPLYQPRTPPSLTQPPTYPPPPYNVARQLGIYSVGPQENEERQPGCNRAASCKHHNGQLFMVMAERGIQDALAEQRSTHVPPHDLPDCFAGKMHESATSAEAVNFPQALSGVTR